jgi:hypothetical protein
MPSQRIKDQRSLAVKTCEALQRAIDDLNVIFPHKNNSEAVRLAKLVLELVKGWK